MNRVRTDRDSTRIATSLSERLGELERQFAEAGTEARKVAEVGGGSKAATASPERQRPEPIRGVVQLVREDGRPVGTAAGGHQTPARNRIEGAAAEPPRAPVASPHDGPSGQAPIRSPVELYQKIEKRCGAGVPRTLWLVGASTLVMTAMAIVLPLLAPRDEPGPSRPARRSTAPAMDRLALFAGAARSISVLPAVTTALERSPGPVRVAAMAPSEAPPLRQAAPAVTPAASSASSTSPPSPRPILEMTAQEREFGLIALPLSVLGETTATPGAALLIQGLPEGTRLSRGMQVTEGGWLLYTADVERSRVSLPDDTPDNLQLTLRVIGRAGDELSVRRVRLNVLPDTETVTAAKPQPDKPPGEAASELSAPPIKAPDAVASSLRPSFRPSATIGAVVPDDAIEARGEPTPAAKAGNTRRPLVRSAPTARKSALVAAKGPIGAAQQADPPSPAYRLGGEAERSAAAQGATIRKARAPKERQQPAIIRNEITNMPSWAPFGTTGSQ